MTTEAKIQLTSTELGRLWMAYQIRSAMLVLFGQFKDKMIDAEAKSIYDSNIIDAQKSISEISKIFNDQSAIIPLAFDDKDSFKDAPPLFDDIFKIMFLRQISKLGLVFGSLYLATSYMKEVQDLFRQSHAIYTIIVHNKYINILWKELMNKTIKIENAVSAVLAELEEQRYSSTTIKSYRCNYNVMLKYAKERGINYYNEQVGLDYLENKYGLSINGFYGAHPKEISAAMRCMQVLWDYTEYGKIAFRMRGKDKPYECPTQFKIEYDAFNKACIERKYAPQGFKAIIKPVRRFLVFLQYSNVESSEYITSSLTTKFLSNYASNKTSYISTIISGLKNYTNFLYQNSFISEDISRLLPKVRIIRNSFIPSVWKTQDVKKLLESIDRGNPTGKRDYAIFLTVVRLGLRISDIRALKLSNLNWNLKIISIIMQKTKQPLELPILEDVGWAIIDYLKNGRPETSSDILFIRHRALRCLRQKRLPTAFPT